MDKTLKCEEVYRQEYRNLAEARASIARFIEKVYNEKRLHSALGYRPPVSSSEHCWWRAARGLDHDRRTQRALERKRWHARRCAAGSHLDPRGGGENPGWRAGGWFGSEARVGPARAGAWRPTDPRCSSRAAENTPDMPSLQTTSVDRDGLLRADQARLCGCRSIRKSEVGCHSGGADCLTNCRRPARRAQPRRAWTSFTQGAYRPGVRRAGF